MRRAPPVAAALLCAASLAAQEPAPALSGIRGGIVTESGDRVPYALVGIAPSPPRFATAEGLFAITGLAPGTYRLAVRQVGYRPFDTTVTLGTRPVVLRIELRRITIALPALLVGVDAPCSRPGVPSREIDPALAELFEQLRENAERSRTLAVAYPYRFHVQRAVFSETSDGDRRLRRLDTLELRSGDTWQYEPGRVVTWGRGTLSRTRLVHLPELSDIADSVFHHYHCFSIGGIDTIGGMPLVRLDFKPDVALRSPDVIGSAWLDRERYQLRRLRVELTRADRADRDVSAMNATVTFREEWPYIAVMEGLIAMTMWRRPIGGIVGQSEEQRLVRLEFARRPGEGEP